MADPAQWIRVGITTKAEVIEPYGEPDLVIATQEGETAVYRSRVSVQSTPRLEIPTAQTGPFGSQTTKMDPIYPVLSASPTDAGARERPEKEFRLRYNTRGMVRELIQ